MYRKWTFFISSTFEDLRPERQAVRDHILELEEIPIGMEQFGAIDKSSWENIKKLIDTVDYYILIIAGRYGSIDTDGSGQSYTEKEYWYAKSRGIPIIALLHNDYESLPAKFCEKSPEMREKLAAFRKEASTRQVKFYTSLAELIGGVSASITKTKREFPRPGWVRDGMGDEKLQQELAEKTQLIDDLRVKLQAMREGGLISEEEDRVIDGLVASDVRKRLKSSTMLLLRYSENGKLHQTSAKVSWNDIFMTIAERLHNRHKHVADMVSIPSLTDLISEGLASVAETVVGRRVEDVTTAPDFEENASLVFESLNVIVRHRLLGYILTKLGRKIYVDARADEIMPPSQAKPKWAR